MSDQQRPVHAQGLLLTQPRPAVVGDSDQTARGVTTRLDQEEHPGVGRHVQGNVHAESVAQPGHTPYDGGLQPLPVPVPRLVPGLPGVTGLKPPGPPLHLDVLVVEAVHSASVAALKVLRSEDYQTSL